MKQSPRPRRAIAYGRRFGRLSTLRKSAAALFLSGRIGEVFDALVTDASDKGTWVRVLTPPVEGRLTAGYHGVDVGDRIRVELTGLDVDRGFIDFERSGGETAPGATSKQSPPVR